MKLIEFLYFKVDGDIVEGCFIMCPECEVGSHHREWQSKIIICTVACCNGVAAIECPDCHHVHCADHGPVLDIAPPFQINSVL